MSGLRSFLSNLSGPSAVFLGFATIGAIVAVIGALAPGGVGNGLEFGLFAFGVWLFLGLLFAGVVWVVSTLSMWRRSLATRSSVQRDPAVQALRERFARGELDEKQFEAMLSRLKDS